jgi:hypothetical protein
MDKMMGAMDVKPSGDMDQDFAAMMIPHHQGAIDMAQLELRYGRNEQLRRIAQEIIVDQQQEIAVMRLALNQPAPPSQASPDQPVDLRLRASRPDDENAKGAQMKSSLFSAVLGSSVLASSYVFAGQAPGSASAPDIPISHRDRVYAAEQFSNTVSVTDPMDNKLLGVIRLGEPQPTNFSPLYRGQLLVHGMGF